MLNPRVCPGRKLRSVNWQDPVGRGAQWSTTSTDSVLIQHCTSNADQNNLHIPAGPLAGPPQPHIYKNPPKKSEAKTNTNHYQITEIQKPVLTFTDGFSSTGPNFEDPPRAATSSGLLALATLAVKLCRERWLTDATRSSECSWELPWNPSDVAIASQFFANSRSPHR